MTNPEDASAEQPTGSPFAATALPVRLRGWARVENWIDTHSWLPVLVVLAGGLLARVLTALPTALNPDEAIHFGLSDYPSLLEVYRQNLSAPHPPLLHLLLYVLRLAGDSDFFLRLPSVLAGSFLALAGYLWLKELFDRTTGLIGMILLAFAPAVIYTSAEIREYALLLCFLVFSFYCLEAGLRRRSVVLLVFFGIAQLLAFLSHYSSMIVLFASGCYSLYRVIHGRIRGRVLLAWLGAEAALVALLGFQYATQLSGVRGGSLETHMKNTFLNWLYFRPDRDTVLGFVASRAAAAAGFLFSSRVLGLVALLLFLAGVVILLMRAGSPDRTGDKRPVALLLLGPWVVAAGAGFTGMYPFGGTRHIFFLLPAAVAGIAVAIRRLAGRRSALILLAAALLVPAWNVTRGRYAAGWNIPLSDSRREHPIHASQYIRELLPEGGIVFADIQSSWIVSHYMFHRRLDMGWRMSGYYQTRAEGIRIATALDWALSADSFGNRFHRMAESYGLEPGTRVVVATTGWGPNYATDLKQRLGIAYPELRDFGGLTSVFVVPVGTEVMTDSLATQVSRVHEALGSLRRDAGRAGMERMAGVLWPAYFLDDSTRTELGRLARHVTTFVNFSDSAIGGSDAPEKYLPALVFWPFGTKERHLDFMRYMNERESYRFFKYRFTLLATDPDTLVGVYLFESSTREELQALLVRAQALGRRISSVFWPGQHLRDADTALIRRLSKRMLTYGDLDTLLADREIPDLLPALAFWEADTREGHPGFMGRMDDLGDFRSAGCRFTLLGVGKDSIAALYLIEPAVSTRLAPLAMALAEVPDVKPASILIPTRDKATAVQELTDDFAGSVLSYTELYQLIGSGAHKLEEFLPALALWEFGSSERHPELMRYMDDRENYISAGYRFTLLRADAAAAVYLIDR